MAYLKRMNMADPVRLGASAPPNSERASHTANSPAASVMTRAREILALLPPEPQP